MNDLLDKTHPAVVYDLDYFYGLGGWIDRRDCKRTMRIAVDLRSKDKRGGMWIYWGSAKSLVQSLKKIRAAYKELSDITMNFDIRILDTTEFTVLMQCPAIYLLQVV